VSDQVKSDSIREFHRTSLSEAQDALSLPTNERHFKSMFFLLNEEAYQTLIVEIKEALQRITNRYGKDSKQDPRLYQLNLSLVPKSKKLKKKLID
jgi:hypothetical protein